MHQDEQHLDTLGVLHYVLGGLTALFACIPFIHLAIGVAVVSGALTGPDAPPAAFGWLFIVVAACAIAFGWTIAVMMLITGRKLRTRRARTLCFIVAAIECMFVPLGTILGVFTIVVLSKESVKHLFELDYALPRQQQVDI